MLCLKFEINCLYLIEWKYHLRKYMNNKKRKMTHNIIHAKCNIAKYTKTIHQSVLINCKNVKKTAIQIALNETTFSVHVVSLRSVLRLQELWAIKLFLNSYDYVALSRGKVNSLLRMKEKTLNNSEKSGKTKS